MKHTIEAMIRKHYSSYWNQDPDVDMEDLFSTLREDTLDRMIELEEERRNLEKAWMDFYPETDSRHWQSVEPTLELVFLRSIFPSTFHKWLSGWQASIQGKCPSEKDRKAEERENDIWQNVLETYREIYREIHNQEPPKI